MATPAERRAEIARENGKKGGRPAGTKLAKTLAKEAARELVREMVTEELGPLVRAQLAKAKGLSQLIVRDKATGQFKRVATKRDLEQGVRKGEETFEVWQKIPDTTAYADLMNRALDKPKEQVQELKLEGDWDKLAARLARVRTEGK